MVTLRSFLTSLLFLLTLAGCSLFDGNPVIETLRHVVPGGSEAERVEFDPGFRYLRVETGGNVIFMASDTPRIDTADTVDIWYSAGREVLRFRNGRLVAAVGLGTEWRGIVVQGLPTWAEIASATQPVRWSRIRDVMPGYRYGVHDALVLQGIPPPDDSQLKGIDPYSLTWYEERLDAQNTGTHSRGDEELPPARYALDTRNAGETVVYGEQCLSAELCFSWQRWPVHMEARK
jgi:Group 4 capsule polysaccharide lipoprotein gfcB, YjbF